MTPPTTLLHCLRKVLDHHTDSGVQALIRLAGGGETEWLEFKAASQPQGGRLGPGETEADYRWNVAKAVIAMANSVGGALLLGVDNAGNSVGLDASDPRGIRSSKDSEAFRREVLFDQVLLPGSGWKTGREGTLKVDRPELLERLIEVRERTHQGQTVLVVLVDAVPIGDDLLLVERIDGPVTERIFVRDRGESGRVRDLSPRRSIFDAHDKQREQFLQSEPGLLWRRFVDQKNMAVPEIRPDLSQAISRYLEGFIECFGKLEQFFVPLDAWQCSSDHDVFCDPVLEARAVQFAGFDHGFDFADFDKGFGFDIFDRDDDKDLDEDEKSLGRSSELDATSDENNPLALRSGDALALLAEARRAILLGEPGSGKTACLGRWALNLAKAYQPGAGWVAWVPLSRYTGRGLLALVAEYSKVAVTDLQSELVAGRLSLCLDALNECPGHWLDACCQEIAALLRDYPNLSLIVTARLHSPPASLPPLPGFELQPLNRTQQLEFLTRYLHGDIGRANQLLAQLDNQPHTGTNIGNPAFLKMVVAEANRSSSSQQGFFIA